jgi:hypothetical protein
MSKVLLKIDFDNWVQLAKSDPEAFEQRRKQVLQELIDSAPEDQQHRLSCLQWKVDQVRGISKTPLAACLRMSKLMWERVLGAGGLMPSLEKLSAYSKAYPGKPELDLVQTETATILQMGSSRGASANNRATN